MRVRISQRLFLLYARTRRGMTLGVRAAVFDPQGRVLLVKHGYVPGWHLPGGGVERGETLELALARELVEECGVTLGTAPELFGIYLNRISRRDHIALFVVRDWVQNEKPKRSFEIVESGFFPVDALPDGTTRSTRQRIAEITRAEARSQEW
jgi:ADP-ribose pyrophosphatase YjhB (NUDIX family)